MFQLDANPESFIHDLVGNWSCAVIIASYSSQFYQVKCQQITLELFCHLFGVFFAFSVECKFFSSYYYVHICSCAQIPRLDQFIRQLCELDQFLIGSLDSVNMCAIVQKPVPRGYRSDMRLINVQATSVGLARIRIYNQINKHRYPIYLLKNERRWSPWNKIRLSTWQKLTAVLNRSHYGKKIGTINQRAMWSNPRK